jgi:hypothetical protein
MLDGAPCSRLWFGAIGAIGAIKLPCREKCQLGVGKLTLRPCNGANPCRFGHCKPKPLDGVKAARPGPLRSGALVTSYL